MLRTLNSNWHIGVHDTSDRQFRRGKMFACRDQRKLLGMVGLKVVGIEIGLDGHGNRASARSFFFFLSRTLFASGEKKAQTHAQSYFDKKRAIYH
jgi:hypothetical protein